MNDVELNEECMKCYFRNACLMQCVVNPLDALSGLCGKYATGITADFNNAFWTRPKDRWSKDPYNPNPGDLKFCIIPVKDLEQTEIIIVLK